MIANWVEDSADQDRTGHKTRSLAARPLLPGRFAVHVLGGCRDAFRRV